jgi:hypothetical protein
MPWALVLVHRDGDPKTCLGSTREASIATAKRVQATYRGVYVAARMPVEYEKSFVIPTRLVRQLAGKE